MVTSTALSMPYLDVLRRLELLRLDFALGSATRCYRVDYFKIIDRLATSGAPIKDIDISLCFRDPLREIGEAIKQRFEGRLPKVTLRRGRDACRF
jgi:hypothetical protein